MNVKLPVSCGETSIVTETGIGRQYLGGSDLAPGPIRCPTVRPQNIHLVVWLPPLLSVTKLSRGAELFYSSPTNCISNLARNRAPQ